MVLTKLTFEPTGRSPRRFPLAKCSLLNHMDSEDIDFFDRSLFCRDAYTDGQIHLNLVSVIDCYAADRIRSASQAREKSNLGTTFCFGPDVDCSQPNHKTPEPPGLGIAPAIDPSHGCDCHVAPNLS